MDRNRQVAIIFLVLGMGAVAVAGFLLRGKHLQDKTQDGTSFNNSDIPTDLFSDFKAGKEDIIKTRQGSVHNSGRNSSAENQAFCWNKKSGNYEETDLPAEIAAIARDNSDIFFKRDYADLNGNNIREEYALDDGRLTVQENSKVLWQSDKNWWVEDFSLADSDNDSVINLNLSAWKSGNFGKYKPFWIKENDPSVKNHFFVFAFRDNKIKPIWQSSNLPAPNCRIAFSDLDADGKNELVALEGDYAQSLDCKGKYISVWKWNEWGFINKWRSGEGEFSGMEVIDTLEKKCVMVF